VALTKDHNTIKLEYSLYPPPPPPPPSHPSSVELSPKFKTGANQDKTCLASLGIFTCVNLYRCKCQCNCKCKCNCNCNSSYVILVLVALVLARRMRMRMRMRSNCNSSSSSSCSYIHTYIASSHKNTCHTRPPPSPSQTFN
jgi:hypothetical protein